MHLTRRHVAAAWSTTTRTHEALRPALPAQLLPTLLLVAELCPQLLHRQHLSSRFAARLLHGNNYIAISSPEQNGYSSLGILGESRHDHGRQRRSLWERSPQFLLLPILWPRSGYVKVFAAEVDCRVAYAIQYAY